MHLSSVCFHSPLSFQRIATMLLGVSDGTSAVLRAMGHLPRPISPFRSHAIDPRWTRVLVACTHACERIHVFIQVCFMRPRAIETTECCAQMGSSTLVM